MATQIVKGLVMVSPFLDRADYFLTASSLMAQYPDIKSVALGMAEARPTLLELNQSNAEEWKLPEVGFLVGEMGDLYCQADKHVITGPALQEAWWDDVRLGVLESCGWMLALEATMEVETEAKEVSGGTKSF
jgi:hypothetical protein